MEMEKIRAPFYKLALGARFNYLAPDNEIVWVKISHDTIAEWNECLKVENWIGQNICCFSESESLDAEVDVL